MIQSAPLVIGPSLRTRFADLIRMAEHNPIDMPTLVERIKTLPGKAEHRRQMTRQSLVIPGIWNFVVAFSIECGHPVGTCRHMSMSIDREGRMPNPEALWMVAAELGFRHGLDRCMTWPEALEGHGHEGRGVAINLIQPLVEPEPDPV
jgi:hypothetical protein